ncbi:MAG: cytochrome c biogenesis protein CcsA [Psychrilyobacter sp.]|nr:cytochrome c biogenesis protein CcsA [Psychrilyobacter sp.]
MIFSLKLLIIIDLAIYFFASLFFIFGLLKYQKMYKYGYLFALFGWLVTVTIFILNWISAQAPPFGNMYHVFIVTSGSVLPAFLILKFYFRINRGEFLFVLGALLTLIPALIKVESAEGWRPPPALQSFYFIPHVFAYMLSYLLLAIAAINSLFLLIKELLYKIKKKSIQDLEVSKFLLSSKSTFIIVRTGFLFLSTGLLLGAFWAETTWGRYWGWDIKETWALVNWVIYILYFHIRKTTISHRNLNIFLVVAFLTLLVTLLGVNYMNDEFSSSLHTYGS